MNGVTAVSRLATAVPEAPSERLAALFDAHYDRLYRLARRLSASADDARDLLQDTFLKAASAPSSVPQGARDEEAWLVRVLINIRRDDWRKAAVRRRHAAIADTAASLDHREEDALIARAAIWQALDALNPRRRAIVVLHEIEGLTVPAIASLLGVAAVTVRWHLSKGRRELARRLRPEGDIR